MNDKQKRFCEEYVKDHNATQAATRAGYSAKTANRMGHSLLKKIDIKKYIKQLQDEAIERNKIDVDRVLQEIQRIALLDPSKMFDENGDVKPIQEMDEDTRRAILSFEVVSLDGDVTINRVKVINKLDALEKFMKHFGAYERDNRQKSDSVIIVGDANFDQD